MPSAAAKPSEVILVKLGGSLITDKRVPGMARTEVLARLAREIGAALPALAAARRALVLGHGSGSFGHAAAVEVGYRALLPGEVRSSGAGRIQDRAAALHRLVMGAVLAAGLEAFSLVPGSLLVARGGIPVRSHLDPLLLALGSGLLVVTCGDVVLDETAGYSICSTETVLLHLAQALPAHGLPVREALWLGETDGVYDQEGRTIESLEETSRERLDGALRWSAGADVTGGMRHRVDSVFELARAGIPSRILSGLRPGLLEDALFGREVPGTRIGARGVPRGSGGNG